MCLSQQLKVKDNSKNTCLLQNMYIFRNLQMRYVLQYRLQVSKYHPHQGATGTKVF